MLAHSYKPLPQHKRRWPNRRPNPLSEITGYESVKKAAWEREWEHETGIYSTSGDDLLELGSSYDLHPPSKDPVLRCRLGRLLISFVLSMLQKKKKSYKHRMDILRRNVILSRDKILQACLALEAADRCLIVQLGQWEGRSKQLDSYNWKWPPRLCLAFMLAMSKESSDKRERRSIGSTL